MKLRAEELALSLAWLKADLKVVPRAVLMVVLLDSKRDTASESQLVVCWAAMLVSSMVLLMEASMVDQTAVLKGAKTVVSLAFLLDYEMVAKTATTLAAL